MLTVRHPRSDAPPDPLADALARKTRAGSPGGLADRTVASGDGWRVLDVVCTAGPQDRIFEERHARHSVSLVLSGLFAYRAERGAILMSPGSLLLGTPSRAFECSHPHGEGDRCLSFQFEPEVFEDLVRATGARRAGFAGDRLPPIPALARPTARAVRALAGQAPFEEVALEVGAAAVTLAAHDDGRRGRSALESTRIASAVRRMAAHPEEQHPLAELAQSVGLSRYHFLRSFERVTGVTPRQWLLRARLRRAAQQLATTREPVTEVALASGFGDLSHFVRSFRREFGAPPSRYRAHG